MAKRLSQAQVLARFNEIHGDKYDYSRVNYVNARTKVEIRCKEHDVWFQQSVTHHERKRNKCFKCQINVSKVLWSDHPDLLADLDLRPGKNEGLTFQGISVQATELSVGTNRILDWKCSTCKHEWNSTGNNRTSGKGCPVCMSGVLHSDGRNSMATTHPKLAVEYQGDATLIVAGTGKKLPWKCSICEHEWKTTGDSRKQGCGCPACTNKALHIDGRNSMAMTHPELALEYQGDATKIIAGTNKKLPWKCRTCEHEWETPGVNRTSGKGCAACNGFLHSDGRNSMAITHPELAAEYQGDATKVIATTEKRLLWKCKTCEHEWRANSRNRVIVNAGCPPCSTKKRVESFKKTNLEKKGSMAETHPELALEYQGDATKIVAFVNQKLLWKCLIVSDNPCGYEWESSASSRAGRGVGCPVCATTGFQPQKPAYYYVNQILNDSGDVIYYKAGISNDWKRRAAKLRRGLPETLTLRPLQQHYFEVGKDASDLETTLLRMAAEEGWKAPPRKFDGGSELFLDNPLDHARSHGLI